MTTTLDIPDPVMVEMRTFFEREGAPGNGVPVQMFVRWANDGEPEFHFGPFVRDAAAQPNQASPEAPRFFAFAERYIHEKPGMKHDMASIRESIIRGRKAEWNAERRA